MKKTTLKKVNTDNVLDIMYEPDKHRYSVLEKNSTRKEITEMEFIGLLYHFRQVHKRKEKEKKLKNIQSDI